METAGTRGRFRTGIATASMAFALLGLVLGTPGARAEDQTSQQIHDDTMWQISICEAGGGTSDVEVDRTVNGIEGTKTRCNGGYFDGVTCYNGKGDPFCVSGGAVTSTHVTPDLPVLEVVGALQTGTAAELQQMLTEIRAAAAGDADQAATGGDQNQSVTAGDQGPQPEAASPNNEKKSKHGKKGKRGGKGHSR